MITCYMGAIAQLGLQGAITLAKENDRDDIVAAIQSLIDAGMTQQDVDVVSTKKWHDNDPNGFVKSKLDYNKTWYWRGCVIANQIITLENGRVTVMQGVTPERLQAAADSAAEEKASEAAAFKELKQSAEALYGVEVVKKILRRKGQVKATLNFILAVYELYPMPTILWALDKAHKPHVAQNLCEMCKIGLPIYIAQKIANKAYAWRYIYNLIPNGDWVGDFDAVKEAAKLYVAED